MSFKNAALLCITFMGLSALLFHLQVLSGSPCKVTMGLQWTATYLLIDSTSFHLNAQYL